MGLELTRQSIVTYLDADWNAAFPTVPMVYDNQPFDWNNAPTNFVTLELQFYHAEQVNLGRSPMTRWNGYAYFGAYTKEGLGSVVLLQQLDWLAAKFKYATIDGIQFKAPSPDGTGAPKGFFGEHLKIPLFFND